MQTAVRENPPTAWSQIVDRQTGYLSPRQNEIVRNTRALMLGVGGMGMNAAANLVRLGFEKFTLVDFDTVDGTTANRAPFAFDDTLGMQKTEATRRYLLKINPGAEVRVHSGLELGLDTGPAWMRELVQDHDVLSWAIDGIAGRIYYTRITHEIGRLREEGRPAVESWGVPYHFSVWTIPNRPGTPSWEQIFGLPTAGVPCEAITPDLLRTAHRSFFRRLGEVPGALGGLDRGMVSDWLSLKIPNRTLGHMIAGCGALVAQEILSAALRAAGEPLAACPAHEAPWMALYDVRRHCAYEYNFMTRQVRWRHPLTGVTRVESWSPPAEPREENAHGEA